MTKNFNLWKHIKWKLLNQKRLLASFETTPNRLGPYTQVDQAIFNTDIFALCKGDRFKSCIQKKKQNEGNINYHSLIITQVKLSIECM